MKATNLPLNRSVVFTRNGQSYVQLGNSAKCCVCIMPAKTAEDFKLIQQMMNLWNKNVVLTGTK